MKTIVTRKDLFDAYREISRSFPEKREYMVNFDLLAIGCKFMIGKEIFKKVSSMISENVNTGELLYDARVMGYPNAKPPMVRWLT